MDFSVILMDCGTAGCVFFAAAPPALRALTLRMSKEAASAFSLLRQARITLAPLFARSRAVALPMPVLLPVQENESHTYKSKKQYRGELTQ